MDPYCGGSNSSETSVTVCQSAQRHTPEDLSLHTAVRPSHLAYCYSVTNREARNAYREPTGFIVRIIPNTRIDGVAESAVYSGCHRDI